MCSPLSTQGLFYSSTFPELATWGLRAEAAATAVAIVAGGILAFSALTYGLGSAITFVAAKLNSADDSPMGRIAKNVGFYIEDAAPPLLRTGRYAFLSVAVPIYTLTWVIPKWIFQEVIPEAARLAHKYLVVPICDGIVAVANYLNDKLQRVIETIYRYVIEPVGRAVVKATQWIWNHVVVPVAQQIDRALDQVVHAIQNVAQFVYDYVLVHIEKMVVKIAKWTWNQVIIPTFDKIMQGIEMVANAANAIGRFIFDYALAPIGRALRWGWNQVVVPAAQKVMQGLEMVAHAANTVGRAIFDCVLHPIGKAIQWVWNIVGAPIVNGVVQATSYVIRIVSEVAQEIFDQFIYPIGQFIVSSFEAAYESVVAAGQSVYHALHFSTGKG